MLGLYCFFGSEVETFINNFTYMSAMIHQLTFDLLRPCTVVLRWMDRHRRHCKTDYIFLSRSDASDFAVEMTQKKAILYVQSHAQCILGLLSHG
jgi:hypothetical protein